jgi:hypothetical protein
MGKLKKLSLGAVPAAVLSGSLVLGSLGGAGASSHREAPLITEDPVADITDVYAFVSPDRPDTVTLAMNVIPFEAPAGGPNFYKFGDDVLYEIHIDNDGDSEADITYEFRFNTTVQNPATFLYNTGPIDSLDDPDWNIRQKYTVSKQYGNQRAVVAEDLSTPPDNVGVRSTPNYEALAQAAIHPLPDGGQVFAGQRDDPFFVDLGSIFDLGGLRPLNQAHLLPLPTEPGRDYVAGYNVHTIAVQVPIDQLLSGTEKVLGVWATTSRRMVRVLPNIDETTVPAHHGPWVQVARLGMPLVNEVVIPVGLKDKFNGAQPKDDVANFGTTILDPELGRLIPVLYPGVTVPTEVDLGLGLGGREDLVAIFATGIPGLNQPMPLRAPGEMIRVNTSIKPTGTEHPLGLLGGDTQGFPNGRRLGDDVTDIELQAVAGATPFTPDFAGNNIITDGVDHNDLPFLESFPYLASPRDGYTDGGQVTGPIAVAK